MTKTFWLVLSAMLSTSLLAQQATNAPSAPAAPATAESTETPAEQEAPAAKKKKGPASASSRAAAQLRTVPLVAGPAKVVASNVNVRGQPKLRSEVVTRVTKDQPVTVLEEVVLKKSAPDEPSAWAKILLPPGAKTYVNTIYVDANKTVKATKLNVRSGPGENYSVIGSLEKGDAVQEIKNMGDWMQIEPPTNSYAFVAAQYLEQQPAESIAATSPTIPTPEPSTPTEPKEPEPTPATVTEPPTVVTTPSDVQAPTNASPVVADPGTNEPMVEPQIDTDEEPVEEPPPPRIVQREGFVRATTSIQAPTEYELVSTDTGRRVNYLYTSSPNLDLSRYKGLRIVVTGEESLDRRWKATPLITIQKIIVIE